jgi:hypothetical protein
MVHSPDVEVYSYPAVRPVLLRLFPTETLGESCLLFALPGLCRASHPLAYLLLHLHENEAA